MKATQIISFGLFGLLMCVPLTASAEEGAGAPIPMLTSVEAQAPAPEPMQDRRQMLREGTPPPMRMMASGTRPLPPKMERMLEQRDKRLASSSRPDCIDDATGNTDCAGRGAERREAIKNQIEERRTEMQERRQERRSEILKRMADQMIRRMNAAIERIEKLSDRVDSRIAKLKEKGVDTSAAEANIVIARAKSAEAKAAVLLAETAIAGAAVNADTVTEGAKPNDAGKPVREALEKARVATVAAHKALVNAIESLKASVKTGVESRKGTTSSVTN